MRLPTGGNFSPALVLMYTQLDSEQVSTCTTLVRLFSELPLNSKHGPPCEPGPPLAPVLYFIFKLKQTYKDFIMSEPPNFGTSQQTIVYAAHFLAKCPENS
jgi:hypothetical protein